MQEQALRSLDLSKWNALTDAQAKSCVETIEQLQPNARFVRFEKNGNIRSAIFKAGRVELVLVPGGTIVVGFDPNHPTAPLAKAWSKSHPGSGHTAMRIIGAKVVDPPEAMVDFLEQNLGPKRTVTLLPFLVERNPSQNTTDSEGDDPHGAIASAVVEAGFRLLTGDEWEHALRQGSDSFFPWGNDFPKRSPWPAKSNGGMTEPNALGLTFPADPYKAEVTADPCELRGGDGGQLVCGDSGPIAWITASPAFRWRLGLRDDRQVCFESALVRRALSVFPSPEDKTILRYRRPNPLESAEAAVAILELAVSEHPGLVLDDENEREELLGKVPRLEQIVRAHKDDPDVLMWSGMVYRKLGKHDEAIVIAERSVAIARTWQTVSQLASAHRAADQVDEAVECFEEASELDPSDTTALMEGARTLGKARRLDEAAEWFSRVLERDPADVEAAAWRAYTLYLATKDAKHAETLRKLAKKFPEDETAQDLVLRLKKR